MLCSDGEMMPGEKNLKTEAVCAFQKTIYQYYRTNARKLPWRETHDPYQILISEIMLQQTQVQRVMKKYGQFITVFPGFSSLAQAPLHKILRVWQGLGYNRRALQLKQIAEIVVSAYQGNLPRSLEALARLPGIGRTSASAILTFAFNEPTAFIETNVRAAFIHFFFDERTDIKDKEIYPLVVTTLERSNPRTWYYALMDYGAMVKRRYRNPSRKSAHYQRQSPFQGSNRQIRGMILRVLLEEPEISLLELVQKLKTSREQLERAISGLQKEGLIENRGRGLAIG